jgi:hypothetical protein
MIIIIIIAMLMLVNLIVLHIKEAYWYSITAPFLAEATSVVGHEVVYV